MQVIRTIFIGFLLIPIIIYGETYQYQVKSIDINAATQISINTDQEQHHIYETQEYKHHWACDLNYDTQIWRYTNKNEESNLVAKRIQNELQITGMYRGKTVDITYPIDNMPWYQFIDVYVPKPLQNKQAHHFWYLRSRDLKPIKLTFKFKKTDTTQIQNKLYPADLYQLSVSKWPSFLWSIDYWIDTKKEFLLSKKVNSNPTIDMTYTEKLTQ